MFSSTGPGRHGWHDNLTCFDLGQQIIISAFLWGLSVRVFPCRAVVARVRVSDLRVPYTPLFLEVSFFGDFLEISGDLPYGRLGFFFSAAPGNGGVACCARVEKFCAFWKPVVFVLPSRM